ncbi:TetR/AcrR family transcriptional regulator [Actinomadura parmotrematis]|uniref:TetR/AcrR family transcriptional regulator n=1 Tax=Actinomadura parmotrematis TaxID=2864039 RepID=UPI00215DAD07|nr:helix-turn-helix domain-containing protein [Actinomadura parmotrematis]
MEATRALLAERGFDATTVQAIAERSGVRASAVYRRWATRTEIIERAVLPGPASVSVRATGDLPADLRRFVGAYLAVLGAPAARAAMPGLLAAHDGAHGHAGRPERWLAVSARPQFADIPAAAPLNGGHRAAAVRKVRR